MTHGLARRAGLDGKSACGLSWSGTVVPEDSSGEQSLAESKGGESGR
jgi:hypothetical protein